MSYDLAVWEGERPAGDKTAGELFNRLYEQYVGTSTNQPPTAVITRYVALLLERWPDLTEDEDEISPWSTGPLIGEASGPLIYFPMVWSMAATASAYAAETAASLGLVCYDPQAKRLRP
ncbi:hypothetical protein [Streptomyces telluris]|uniref:Uncharacterized protein n=1 Tax=Streptomyces telluris TaxID=2720021 RepID=A0A9X2LPW2_9ACTN|nr:hypothetical protein [Streptomyces telluris]MCQ8775075.1 hypothetical protein [Streptomyces telluris]